MTLKLWTLSSSCQWADTGHAVLLTDQFGSMHFSVPAGGAFIVGSVSLQHSAMLRCNLLASATVRHVPWWLQALEGLRVILGVRPQTLATMVPKLLRGTMTATNCKALGSLAEVAGPAIAPHLSNIFPPLLRLASQPDSSSPAGPAAKDALIKVTLPGMAFHLSNTAACHTLCLWYCQLTVIGS